MPGYDVPSGCYQEAQDKDILCSSCNLLIREAVQTLCGHRYCKTCVDELLKSDCTCTAKDCGETFEGDKRPNGDTVFYYPDQFVRKKVAKLILKCKFHERKCPWTGFLTEWESHLETCKFGDKTCPDCKSTINNSKWEEHQQACPGALKPCPLAPYGCPQKELMSAKDLQRHHLQEGVNHMQLLVALLARSQQQPHEKMIFPPGAYSSVDSAYGSYADAVTDGAKSRGVEDVDAPVVVQLPATSQQKLPQSHGDLPHYHELLSQLEEQNLLQRVRGMETRNKQLEDELQKKSKETSEMQTRLNAAEEKCKKLERSYEDVNFRLMLEESHSYGGDMIWRIPSFSQRQEDAKSGKFTSIYSLPFYTHRYGYKMCLRLYPYGDGAGKGTHLSLFIVVMKGDYDEILEWPFKHKVTFQLVNQTGGKDIVDAFRADPQSSSFRKPISDMNIATGCPKFALLDDLQKQGFISGRSCIVILRILTVFLKTKGPDRSIGIVSPEKVQK